MSKIEQKIPRKFEDMYILMGGNPNYQEMEKLTFNKNTGMVEERVKSCPKCKALIPVNSDICPTCGSVTI
mgnify:CR=1 FL=1|tara:strand:- start:1333 stop:1542 length:210 start_codon:yes stop_codon:yes gene_type:complete